MKNQDLKKFKVYVVVNNGKTKWVVSKNKKTILEFFYGVKSSNIFLRADCAIEDSMMILFYDEKKYLNVDTVGDLKEMEN